MFETESMDAVFRALAHGGRRKILDLVSAKPGCRVGDVCTHFEMSRIGVLKHINLLEAANLLISEREGRERRLYFNVVPIQTIYERWTTEYSGLWAGRLTRLKYEVESTRNDSANPNTLRDRSHRDTRDNQEQDQ